MGRMTLDPRVHLTKMGTLAMLLLPIGWANPVIINSRNFKHQSRDTVIVSIAGPLSNLILCFISILILIVLGKYEGIVIPLGFANNYDNFLSFLANISPLMNAVVTVCAVFAGLNALLCIFNLLPIPPLDGSKLLTSWLPYKAREWMWRVEQYGIILLFLVIYILSPIIGWLQGLILNGFYMALHGLLF